MHKAIITEEEFEELTEADQTNYLFCRNCGKFYRIDLKQRSLFKYDNICVHRER